MTDPPNSFRKKPIGQVPGVRLLRLDYLDGLSARALGVASLPLTFLTRSKRFPERAADWREKILRSEPPPVRLFRRLRSAWSRVEFVADSGAEKIRGAQTWAKGAIAFARAARSGRPALVNGSVGVVMAPHGRLFRALSFTITRGKIVQIDVIADPARLRQLDLAVPQ